MRRPAPLLLALLLLAGCVGPAAQEPIAAASAPPTPTEAAVAPTPTPPAAPSPAPSSPTPASTPAPAPENESAAPAPRVAHTTVVTGKATTTLHAAAPCADPAPCASPSHEAGSAALKLAEAGPAKATLTAAWTSKGAPSDTLRVNLTGLDGALLAQAEGTSPLTFEIPIATLTRTGDLVAAAAPVAPGAMIQQEVEFTLLLDYAA